ncbi:MAG: FHA domain-containing protein [Planctomycetota bacterium]
MPKVVIKDGPGTGNEYDVAQGVILGRLDSNDIPVKDTKASREHAKIYKQGGRFAIVDLNSSNGTFVNGERITKYLLEPGDEISIGTVSLLFEDPEAVAEAEAAKQDQRKSLEDAFDSARGEPAAKAAGGKADEIVMRGHQPIQYSKIKAGRPLLGFDLEQLSDGGRAVIYTGLVVVFAVLMYVAYALVTG